MADNRLLVKYDKAIVFDKNVGIKFSAHDTFLE